jgi:signal transduction protein with GAF and PtsI domain
MNLLNGDHSRIFLLDEISEMIILRASYGDESDPGDTKDSFRLGEGFIGKMVQSGDEVLIGDVQEDPAWVNVRWAKEWDLHSYLGQPLRRGGKIIGAIVCLSKNKDAFEQGIQSF